MAMQSPYRVVLTDANRRELTARARSQRATHRDVQRAQIVLAAADEEVNRPGIDGGFQPPKDGSHGGTQEVPRRAA